MYTEVGETGKTFLFEMRDGSFVRGYLPLSRNHRLFEGIRAGRLGTGVTKESGRRICGESIFRLKCKGRVRIIITPENVHASQP